jgi:hypothetical protein
MDPALAGDAMDGGAQLLRAEGLGGSLGPGTGQRHQGETVAPIQPSQHAHLEGAQGTVLIVENEVLVHGLSKPLAGNTAKARVDPPSGAAQPVLMGE